MWRQSRFKFLSLRLKLLLCLKIIDFANAESLISFNNTALNSGKSSILEQKRTSLIFLKPVYLGRNNNSRRIDYSAIPKNSLNLTVQFKTDNKPATIIELIKLQIPLQQIIRTIKQSSWIVELNLKLKCCFEIKYFLNYCKKMLFQLLKKIVD